MSEREKVQTPDLIMQDEEVEDTEAEETFKMRMATSPHHTNPRSRTLVAWKESMSLEDYKYVRQQKKNQKNVPTTISDYREQHLIIANRLAEMEKRRVGTRYLPKDHSSGSKKKGKGNQPDCVIS